MLTNRGLGTVLGDLASMGFNAEWGVLSAADVGANHLRERIWIVGRNMANTRCEHGKQGNSAELDTKTKIRSSSPIHNQSSSTGQISNATSVRLSGQGKHEQPFNSTKKRNWQADYVEPIGSSDFWKVEPNLGRVANGVAASMDRLKAIGNGQVPLCAATAWRLLKERLDGHEQRGVA